MLKIIRLDNKTVRIIRGELLRELKLDWSIKDISKLRKLIEFAISFEADLPALKKVKYKELSVYEGGNHLDLMDKDRSSLGLLRIEDHFDIEE